MDQKRTGIGLSLFLPYNVVVPKPLAVWRGVIVRDEGCAYLTLKREPSSEFAEHNLVIFGHVIAAGSDYGLAPLPRAQPLQLRAVLIPR